MKIHFVVVFFHDILAIKRDKSGVRAEIVWFPWTGNENSRTRQEFIVITRHDSTINRNKFCRHVMEFMRRSCM